METGKVRLTKKERVERNRINMELLSESFEDFDGVNKIMIDCSFDKIMTEFEKSSLARQVQQCYSHLRREGSGKTQMFVSSINDDLMNRFHKQGGDQWVVHFQPESLEEAIGSIENSSNMTHRVIMMSPDADKELTTEDLRGEGNIFVIGGIVDRSVSRNETSHKAIRLGFESRKLPIDVDRFINKVLNIDSVFLFLLRSFSSSPSCRTDLLEIVSSVIPERKKKSSISVVDRKRTKSEAEGRSHFDLLNSVKLVRYNLVELFS